MGAEAAMWAGARVWWRMRAWQDGNQAGGALGHVLASHTAPADALQRPLVPRSRFRARLSGSVRWPARRVVNGTLSLSVAVGAGCGRGSGPGPDGGGMRSSTGRPGVGTLGPRLGRLPPPNHALEPTAPTGSVCPCVGPCLGAAAHRGRSCDTRSRVLLLDANEGRGDRV